MLHLASSYPSNLFPNVGRILLNVTLSDEKGEGELLFDPNILTFNVFGDQTSTTYMLFQGYKVKLDRQRQDDSTGRERRLYLLTAEGLQGLYHLVVTHEKDEKKSGLSYRLVITIPEASSGIRTAVIPLEHV